MSVAAIQPKALVSASLMSNEWSLAGNSRGYPDERDCVDRGRRGQRRNSVTSGNSAILARLPAGVASARIPGPTLATARDGVIRNADGHT
jgi:hypothetical protein